MTSAELSGIAKRWLPHIIASIVLGVLLVWDRETYAAIEGFRSPFLTWLTDWVSDLRGAAFPAVVGLVLIGIGLIGRKSRFRRAGAAVTLTVLLSGTITMVMKEIIARPGPEVDDAVKSSVSWLDARFGRFPSGHAAVTFAAASVLAAFVPAAAVPGFTVAVLVCHERIYRGTHFPSDIFAGIWIGVVVARFMIAQLARRGWLDDPVPERPYPRPLEAAAYAWAEDKRKGGDGEDDA